MVVDSLRHQSYFSILLNLQSKLLLVTDMFALCNTFVEVAFRVKEDKYQLEFQFL